MSVEALCGWLFCAVSYASLVGPAIFLSTVWFKLYRQRMVGYPVAIPALASFSYLYLIAGLLVRAGVLGADHSNRRMITAMVHGAFTFQLFLFTLFRPSPLRLLVAGAAFTLALAWGLVLASSAS